MFSPFANYMIFYLGNPTKAAAKQKRKIISKSSDRVGSKIGIKSTILYTLK